MLLLTDQYFEKEHATSTFACSIHGILGNVFDYFVSGYTILHIHITPPMLTIEWGCNYLSIHHSWQ